MRRYRSDDNDSEIVQAWRKLGWCVKPVGQHALGFDAIGLKLGRVVFAEIKDGNKTPSRRAMTAKEIAVRDEFARFGVPIILLEKISDLAQLDRDARRTFEPGAHDGRSYDDKQIDSRTARAADRLP